MSALLSLDFSTWVQIGLGLSLALVAMILIGVDRKLSAFKKGTDGMIGATQGMIDAIARAEEALAALKAGEEEARARMAKRLDEAKAAADTLKFLTTTHAALAPDGLENAGRLPWKQAEKPLADAAALMRQGPPSMMPPAQKPMINDAILGGINGEGAKNGPARKVYPDSEPDLPRARAGIARRWENLR